MSGDVKVKGYLHEKTGESHPYRKGNKIRITINGREVFVPKGTRILEAAKMIGVSIPTLCYHPDQEIKANWQQAIIVGVIAGAVRIVAAVGIFRIRRWGVVLGMVQSAITLATFTFYLPFGVMDAVLSSIALVALVMVWWGKEKITG